MCVWLCFIFNTVERPEKQPPGLKKAVCMGVQVSSIWSPLLICKEGDQSQAKPPLYKYIKRFPSHPSDDLRLCTHLLLLLQVSCAILTSASKRCTEMEITMLVQQYQFCCISAHILFQYHSYIDNTRKFLSNFTSMCTSLGGIVNGSQRFVIKST